MSEQDKTRFTLNKLVRDGVYEDMVSSGQEPEGMILTGEEKRKALIEKAIEELKEYIQGGQIELKDAWQVWTELLEHEGLSLEELEKQRAISEQKRGGFAGGHFVARVALSHDDPWAEYYRQSSDRHPEFSWAEDCVFCQEYERNENSIVENQWWRARWDQFPATPGHVEILPLRHVQFVSELCEAEASGMVEFARDVADRVRQTDLKTLYNNMLLQSSMTNQPYIQKVLDDMSQHPTVPDAFNYGLNDGPIAGQSVPHLHLHVMPRWKGDMDNPKGGVRNLFPSDTYGRAQ